MLPRHEQKLLLVQEINKLDYSDREMICYFVAYGGGGVDFNPDYTVDLQSFTRTNKSVFLWLIDVLKIINKYAVHYKL